MSQDDKKTKELQELHDFLTKAIESGKFLVTVSYKGGDEKGKELKHFWTQTGYPKADMLKSLDIIKADLEAKELRQIGGKEWE